MYHFGSAAPLGSAPPPGHAWPEAVTPWPAAIGVSPPPLAELTPHSSRPAGLRPDCAISCQMACSWTVVPGVPPRDTNVDLPAMPDAATAANARAMSCGAPVLTPAGSGVLPASTKSLIHNALPYCRCE